MLTFTSKLAVCLVCLVAVLSVPALGAVWWVVVAVHAFHDAIWWLLVAVAFFVTGAVFELWRGLWRFLDPRRRP